LVTKVEGERQLGRPRHKWEANVKMDITVIEWVWNQFIEHKLGTITDECSNNLPVP
jgi:hypothetical protein